ncbi:unnamed protein product [Cuscuta campestris]|uniref:Uncharacterized protein n=1 Tax=Cuscuta campestris TaxID=132261 RepID=A0A484KT19_9ASTE|nr:unnamed protein product [Cuscuta campestris]
MAVLALPLVTAIFRPRNRRFSFFIAAVPSAHLLPGRRFFSRNHSISALNTHSASHKKSAGPDSENQKKSRAPTFQQAIQRLQEKEWMDKIQIEDIHGRVGVALMEDKLQEARLTWFEHVLRRSMDDPVRGKPGVLSS